MSRFNFNLNNKKNRLTLVVISALLMAAFLSLFLFSTFAGTGTGVAYDWQTGTSPSNFKKVGSRPAGWDFVYFGTGEQANSTNQFGIWVPVSDPMIGSRELSAGDSGEDVMALQIALNQLRPTDQADQYYYDAVRPTGTYDQMTANAVYTLQGFFGYPQDGVATLDFQSTFYEQVVTK